MTPWLLVAGDFFPQGGMDVANHGLAAYLGRWATGDVHLVAHRIAPDLCALPQVRVHRVPRPLGAHTLGEPLLRRSAERYATVIRDARGHVVANGGNVDAGDVSWVHYVHAADTPCAAGVLNRGIVAARHAKYLREERQSLRNARLIIANSDRTARDVVERVGVDAARVRRAYYGTDSERFHPAADPSAARAALGWPVDRLNALFIGALGDRRKNFDTLLDAWRTLAGRGDWDVELRVAGAGAELHAWQACVARDERLAPRVHFLGYRADVPALLRGSDVLIHPARYEAYGLAVHEALCCGIPGIVSASAGIAERYPEDLRDLLLEDCDSSDELARRLLAWRQRAAEWRARVQPFSERLRARSWGDMARDIVAAIEA